MIFEEQPAVYTHNDRQIRTKKLQNGILRCSLAIAALKLT
jgi:hypothetical protein